MLDNLCKEHTKTKMVMVILQNCSNLYKHPFNKIKQINENRSIRVRNCRTFEELNNIFKMVAGDMFCDILIRF